MGESCLVSMALSGKNTAGKEWRPRIGRYCCKPQPPPRLYSTAKTTRPFRIFRGRRHMLYPQIISYLDLWERPQDEEEASSKPPVPISPHHQGIFLLV